MKNVLLNIRCSTENESFRSIKRWVKKLFFEIKTHIRNEKTSYMDYNNHCNESEGYYDVG